MDEVRIDPHDFYNAADAYSEQLFQSNHEPIGQGKILILEDRDGTETEAILPIAEYRRLKRVEESHADLLAACQAALESAESEGVHRYRGTDEPREFVQILRASIDKATSHQEERSGDA